MKKLLALAIAALMFAGCSKITQDDVGKAEFEYGVIMGAVIMAKIERSDPNHHYWKLPTKALKGRYIIRKAYMERGKPNEKSFFPIGNH